MVTVALTFDDLGSALEVGRGGRRRPDWNDPALLTGYPRILALLDQLGLRGTFFVEGWSLLHYPAHIADLLERGHEVALHGWVHEHWSTLAPADEERLLGDGLAALDAAGVTVPGFRAPHGVLSGHSVELLTRLGFRFDSSLLTEDDVPPGRPRPLDGDLVNIPFTWPMVDIWQYETWAHPLTAQQLATEWLGLVDAARKDAPLVTLVIHPHVSGVLDDRYAAVERVLRTVAADPAARVCRAGDLLDPLPAPAAPPVDAQPASWVPYLRGRGVLTGGPWTWGPQETLVGGVSCEAIRVGEVVAKRPRALLAVAGHWPADRGRIIAEGTAMARFPALAPAVLDLDAHNLVLAMAFAGGAVWRDQLMDGTVDLDVVRWVATALRAIHAGDPSGLDGADRFAELRLDPYFTGLPDVGPIVERLRSTTTHLIHGDYSPKNILVRRGGPDPDVTVLDWEVACAGDPVFDLAFLLTHLVAKSVHLPAHTDEFRAACAVLVGTYGPVDADWLARVLGAILLARVDGLSPLSYLDDHRRALVRALGTALVREGGPLPWSTV